MRVLHFYKTAFPDTVGGVEQVIDQIARGTSSAGIDVHVLALAAAHGPRIVELNGYRLHRARLDVEIASTGLSISAPFHFARLARNADVVHYHFPWPYMDVVHFIAGMNRPAVVTYHSDIIRQRRLLALYRPLQRRFLRSVDRIVATSPNYLATSDVLAEFADKVEVIPIGLDKASYPPPQPDRIDFWRSRLGAKFFLFVGLIRYYKGLHILLEAARGVEYPIVIVGAGPIEHELKAQAARLGLRNVRFLGRLPEQDKVALLTLCYAVVFPSHLRSEAFGVSLLEGAMYGKPMISSEIGTGTTFINVGGQTGLVTPPGDAAALREAMCYLWDNPAEAECMGRRAEQRYWMHFTAEKMVSAYVSVYREATRYDSPLVEMRKRSIHP